MGEDRRMEPRRYGGHPPGWEEIESPPSAGSRLLNRWNARSRHQRVAVAVSAWTVAAATVGVYGMTEVRSSLAARALDDQVTVQAALGVAASSMSAGGGRVDFYASVRNAGPRSVSVTRVEISAAHLQIVSGRVPGSQVAPGGTAQLPLSVRIDCAAPAAGPVPHLSGTVVAVASSGREHAVETIFGQSRLVTDVVDRLCAIKPQLRNVELDGPVR